MKQVSMIGLDLAKNVFQVHGVDSAGEVVVRRQLRRAQVEKFFAGLAPTIVGLEACGGAHHWGRVLSAMGHEVRMMPPNYVAAYVKRNKTDGRDAEAIREAAGRPTMRFVPVKTIESQAAATLHRTRQLLVRQRTMAGNALRSMMAEYGLVAPQGVKGLCELMAALADPAGETGAAIPEVAREALLILVQQWGSLNAAIRKMESQIVAAARADAAARRLVEISGLGPIGATAILAKVADARVFKSGRDFAAWLGLTPRQFGTGGKQRAGGISKQGDRNLRSLLVCGAASRLRQERRRDAKDQDPWLHALMARRPFKVAAVAYAAKMARIIWAMLVTGEHYRGRGAAARLAAIGEFTGSAR
jgi:transposase